MTWCNKITNRKGKMNQIIAIVKDVLLNKYAKITGRANRTEFWTYVLTVAIVVGIVDGICYAISSYLGYVISTILGLALIVPNICISVRRMHDLGKGGGYIFVACIPLVGWIWYLVLLLSPSEMQANRFGDVPTTDLNIPIDSVKN